MQSKVFVNFGNLILSLSDALDLASPSLAMHQQRVAFIAWELSKRAGLDKTRIERIFLAGLLHDIGALSIEDKKTLHANETSMVDEHCIRGSNLFKSNQWLADCADLVRYHHREWISWDKPRNTPIVLDSQILFLADYIERHIDRNKYILEQNEDLCEMIKELSDKQVNGETIDLFLDLSYREEFWLDLTSPRLYSLLLHNGPFQNIGLDLDNITTFAKLLGMIVDFKSPYTATHSSGVAYCSSLLAILLGMSQRELQLIEAAGLLHDLGKLVVPNTILEKPSALTTSEFAVIKQHPYHTYSILNSISGIQVIAEWAAFHHERLDGNGYPFHKKSHEINIISRIIAVADIFTALIEDRPYRKGMNTTDIKKILIDSSDSGALDSRLVKNLVDNLGDIRKDVREKQALDRHFYQTEIERLN
jgi:HD-GYP domain-containing protein (c-di-GMP phosphodiesterase class II)